MTWFKVDDLFWSHPKVIRTSSLAIGVWARVGSYCASQLTDGLVHIETVHTICPESRSVVAKAVAELVRVGLWTVVDDACQYHDWPDHQPSKSDVLAKRETERERKARQRRNKRGQFTVLPGGSP